MLDFFSLHPATRILIWIGFAAFAFSAPTHALAWMTPFLGLLLAVQKNALFFRMLRRIRWILFSLILIYAFETPGEPVFHSGPTYEGLVSGATQAWRIALAMGLLAFLQEATGREEMVSGLYTLLLPLRRWIRADRIAVRLMLTLHYAEEKLEGNWRDRVIAAFREKECSQTAMRLPIYSFRMRDGAAFLALAALFLL